MAAVEVRFQRWAAGSVSSWPHTGGESHLAAAATVCLCALGHAQCR